MLLQGGVDTSYQINPSFNGTNGISRPPIDLNALNQYNQLQAFNLTAGLGGGLAALAAMTRPPVNVAPVYDVRPPAGATTGTGGNITQNTTYSQPYTVNNTTNTQVDAPLMPVQHAAMDVPQIGRNGPMAMIPLSAQFAAPGMSIPQFGAMDAVSAAALPPVPPPPGAAPGATPGVTQAAGGDGGMPQGGPLLQRDQGPQQPQAPMMVPPPPQQAPPVVAAAAPAQAPPGQQPPLLKGEEDYAQPTDIREKTSQMQGAGAAGPSKDEQEALKFMQALLDAHNKKNSAPPPAAPSPAPQRPQHIMQKPNPMLMMMSPKLAKMFVESRAAEYKAQAEAALKADEHNFELMKQREHDSYNRDTEMQKIELKSKLDNHLTKAQEMDQRSKFWRLPPDSNERWDIAHEIPDLRNKIGMAQDEKAASEAKASALDSSIKALELAKKQEEDKWVKGTAENAARKLAADTEGQLLDNAKTRQTWDADVTLANTKSAQAQEDLRQSLLTNPVEAYNKALQAASTLQQMDNRTADQHREDVRMVKGLIDSYASALLKLPDDDPSRIYFQESIYAMATAMGTGTKEQYTTKNGVQKERTIVRGDMTLPGSMMRNQLQGGVNFQAPQAPPVAPQRRSQPAMYKSNGLVPPPGAIAPSIIPDNIDQIIQQANAKFGPNGLAQAPAAVNVGPAPYSPAFGQPRQDSPVPQVPQNPVAQSQGDARPQGPRTNPPQPQVHAGMPQAPQQHQGTVKSAVERSIEAGHWVGEQEPTLAEKMQMLPAVLAGAIAQTMPNAEQEQFKARVPFLSPESRGLPRGTPLTDPDLVSYFARTANGSNDLYSKRIQEAGWTPVLRMDELKSYGGAAQPITNPSHVAQAFQSGYGDLLTEKQRKENEAAKERRRKDRWMQTASGGKTGFNILPTGPMPNPRTSKVASYQARY